LTNSATIVDVLSELDVLTVAKLGVARYLLGMLLLLLVKVVAKVVFQEVLTQLCRLVGMTDVVCKKRASEVTGKKIHYSHNFIAVDQVRRTWASS